MKPLATSFFLIKIKNDIVVYIFWLLPDYEDRITLWPPGVLISHPEPWSSDLQGSLLLFLFPNTEDRPRTEAGTGWGFRDCRTLGKRSEVMHFSIRFWLTFFFTKMDTQCSITSWISVPLKACGQVRGWWEWPRPLSLEGGGAFETRRRGSGNIAEASVCSWEHDGKTSVKRNAPFLIGLVSYLVQTVQGWVFFFPFLYRL